MAIFAYHFNLDPIIDIDLRCGAAILTPGAYWYSIKTNPQHLWDLRADKSTETYIPCTTMYVRRVDSGIQRFFANCNCSLFPFARGPWTPLVS